MKQITKIGQYEIIRDIGLSYENCVEYRQRIADQLHLLDPGEFKGKILEYQIG